MKTTFTTFIKQKSRLLPFFLFVISLLSVSSLRAQATISAFGTAVTQNFDAMGTANFSLTDNSTTSFTGWYSLLTNGNASPNLFTAGTGSSGTGRFYNFGSTSSTDRAMGTVNSSAPGTSYYGIRLKNTSGSTINSLTITYTGEEWRVASTSPQALTVDYQIAASPSTVTAINLGSWTNIPELTFTSPNISTATGTAIDGNASGNRTVAITKTLTGITLNNNDEIMIRWVDIDHAGTDDGLAIDDVSITAPAPVTTSYYYKGTGDLAAITNWTINSDGSGSGTPANNPSNFTTNLQTFYIRNTSAVSTTSSWTVSGTASKIVVGDVAVAAVNLTIANGFAIIGTIDAPAALSGSNTITIQNITSPTYGTLDATSTVNYVGTSQTIAAANYGNFSLTSAVTPTFPSGTVGIAGTFTPAAITTASSGTINLNGTGNQSIPVFTYNNLTVSGTRMSTPTITLASGTLNITGNLSFSASGAVTYINTGNIVNFNGSIGQTISSSATTQPIFDILTVSNTSSAILLVSNPITVNTTLTVKNGATLQCGALVTVTNGGTVLSLLSGSKIIIATSSFSNGISVVPATVDVNSTIVYTTPLTTQTITGNITYGNLTITGTRSSNISWSSGTITILGNFTYDATFTSGSLQLPNGNNGSRIQFAGTGPQSVIINSPFLIYNLTNTNTAGAVTFTGNNILSIPVRMDLVSGSITDFGTLTVDAPIYSFSGLTGSSTSTFGSTSVTIPSSSNCIAPGQTVTGANIAVGTTVATYTSGATTLTLSQNATGSGTTTLTFSNTANKLNTTVNSGNTAIIKTQSIGATPLATGTTWGGTVEYNGAGAQTLVVGTYNNLTLNNVSGASIGSTSTVNGTLALTAGTLTTNSNLTMGNSATISRAAGILSTEPTFGTAINVTYNGSSLVNSNFNEIPTADILSNLTIANVAGVTLGTTTTVNGVLALTSGALNMSALTVKGSVTRTAGSLTNVPIYSTSIPITYSGATVTSGLELTPSSGTLSAVTLGSASTITLSNSINVVGNLQVNLNSFLNDGGYTATVSGNLSGSGVHTGSGKIIMTGAGKSIALGTMGNLDINQTPTVGVTTIANSTSTITGLINVITGTMATGANILALDATTGTAVFGPTSKLIIASGGIFNANGRSVTLQSTSAGTASIDNIQGTLSNASDVTVERYIPSLSRKKFILATSPVTSTINAGWQEGANGGTFIAGASGYGTAITGGVAQGTNGFDGPVGSGNSIFTYNDNNNPGSKWTALSSTTTASSLAPGTGYLVFVRGDRSVDRPSTGTSSNTTLRATGVVGQGSVSPILLATASQYTLIANPYPCAIDWNSGSITKTNLTSSFTVYDPNLGVFVSSNGAIKTPSSGQQQAAYIQSGQAFFVQAASTSATAITFTEAAKTTSATTTSATTVFGATDLEKAQLNINAYRTVGNVFADGAVALFGKAYSAAVDTKEDIMKFSNFNETFSLRRNEKALGLEARPTIASNDTLFIGMSNFGKRDYSLVVDASNFKYATASLEDNYAATKITLDLTASTTYKFTVNADPASASNDRFMITFGSTAPATVIADAAAAGLYVRMSPNPVVNQLQISFKTADTNNTIINIINSLGQVVKTVNAGKVNSVNLSISVANLSTGIYTVQILSGDKQICTQKIVKE